MSDPEGYTRTQVALHWVIVVLVAGQYLLKDGIKTAWDQRLDGTIPNEPFPNPHAIVGIVILALTLWRLVLRWRNGAPALPAHEPGLLKLVAGLAHMAFYVLLLGLPVSGALAWLAGIEQLANAHELAASAMLALIAVHVVGAVMQKVWLKSDVMARMSPGRIFSGR